MTAPAGQIATLQVPVWSTGFRGPVGPVLAHAKGILGKAQPGKGQPIDIAVTSGEIHIWLLASGDTFAIDLQALCQAAAEAVEANWRPVEARR